MALQIHLHSTIDPQGRWNKDGIGARAPPSKYFEQLVAVPPPIFSAILGVQVNVCLPNILHLSMPLWIHSCLFFLCKTFSISTVSTIYCLLCHLSKNLQKHKQLDEKMKVSLIFQSSKK